MQDPSRFVEDADSCMRIYAYMLIAKSLVGLPSFTGK